MNIWTNLGIGYHLSLSQEISFKENDNQAVVATNIASASTYDCIFPQDEVYSLLSSGRKKAKKLLKTGYTPLLNCKAVTFIPPIPKVDFPVTLCSKRQLESCCVQAVNCVSFHVLEKERNQGDDTRLFWKEKLLCPISQAIFKNPMVDDHGHYFENESIETYDVCPINNEQIKSLVLDKSYKEYVDDLIQNLLIPLPSLEPSGDEDKVTTYLKTIKECMLNGKHGEALAVYEMVCSHTNKSEDYEGLPILFTQMQQPLKAVLAYLHLAIQQIQEEKPAESSITRALELLPDEEALRAMLAFYFLSQDRSTEAKEAFFLITTKFLNEGRSPLAYFEQLLAYFPDDMDIYKEIAACVDDTVKVRLYLIGFASFYEKDPDFSNDCYTKACTLQPQNPLIYFARLCRLEKEDPERVDLYSTLAKIFVENSELEKALYCFGQLLDSGNTIDDDLASLEKLTLGYASDCERQKVDFAFEKIYPLFFHKLPYFEILFKLAQSFTKKPMYEKSVRIYYDLSKSAFLCGDIEKVARCLKKLEKFSTSTLSSEERQFIVMQKYTASLTTQVLSLTTQMKSLSMQVALLDDKDKLIEEKTGLLKEREDLLDNQVRLLEVQVKRLSIENLSLNHKIDAITDQVQKLLDEGDTFRQQATSAIMKTRKVLIKVMHAIPSNDRTISHHESTDSDSHLVKTHDVLPSTELKNEALGSASCQLSKIKEEKEKLLDAKIVLLNLQLQVLENNEQIFTNEITLVTDQLEQLNIHAIMSDEASDLLKAKTEELDEKEKLLNAQTRLLEIQLKMIEEKEQLLSSKVDSLDEKEKLLNDQLQSLSHLVTSLEKQFKDFRSRSVSMMQKMRTIQKSNTQKPNNNNNNNNIQRHQKSFEHELSSTENMQLELNSSKTDTEEFPIPNIDTAEITNTEGDKT